MAVNKDKRDDEKQKDKAMPDAAEKAAQDEESIEQSEAASQTAEETKESKEPTMEQQLTDKLREAEDRHLRLMAEFDNFRRRTAKERESIYPDAVANTVKELLTTLDNFQLALAAPCNDEEYRKGVQMTYNGFMETLGKMGLEQFGEPGEAFDPGLHNAVMHVEDETLGKNVISQVFQRGYKIGDTVLRYAMVQTAN